MNETQIVRECALNVLSYEYISATTAVRAISQEAFLWLCKLNEELEQADENNL